MLSLPVSRSHIPVKSRTDPCRNAGEETTYSTTYTGVDALPWAAMQMVSRADKEKSFGIVPSVPSLRHSAATPAPAYPLFWQERKTPSTWRTILTDLEGRPCSIALQVRVHVRGRAWTWALTTRASRRTKSTARGCRMCRNACAATPAARRLSCTRQPRSWRATCSLHSRVRRYSLRCMGKAYMACLFAYRWGATTSPGCAATPPTRYTFNYLRGVWFSPRISE